MGQSPKRTAHYASLATLRSDRLLWTASAATDDAAFELQIEALCEAARVTATHREPPRGARSIAKVSERIERRESAFERRHALDLQRLLDLEERAAQRRVQRARRRWFIIGRVVDRAMDADPVVQRTMIELLRQAGLPPHELRCFDLAPEYF